jgi:WhiB family transcriptional regulator, redox-sensing transcriptional regulator
VGSRQLLYADDSWMADAHCRGARDGELFPVLNVDQQKVARKWCEDCPVVAECLEYALACNLEWGVWGGRTEVQRRALRAQRRRAAERPSTPERCRNGHVLDEANTRWVNSEGRSRWRCVTCVAQIKERHKQKKVAAGA